MSEGRFLDSAIQLADILGNLHTKGIIQKDIKPDNILVADDRSTLKAIDLGIAAKFAIRKTTTIC